MNRTRTFLEEHGWPGRDLLDCPTSRKRFADGAQYRIEIPSTEGPRALAAVVDEATLRSVSVHRVSQGSGIMLLSDEEIREMVRVGEEHGIE